MSLSEPGKEKKRHWMLGYQSLVTVKKDTKQISVELGSELNIQAFLEGQIVQLALFKALVPRFYAAIAYRPKQQLPRFFDPMIDVSEHCVNFTMRDRHEKKILAVIVQQRSF